MAAPLKVLVVEDSEDDYLLMLAALTAGGFEVASRRVATAADMRQALETGEWDLILADHRLPRFSGFEALEIYKTQESKAPFIVVTGVLSEELGESYLKVGAQDVVQKDYLSRLEWVVRRELERVRELEALQEALAEKERRAGNRRAETAPAGAAVWWAPPDAGATPGKLLWTILLCLAAGSGLYLLSRHGYLLFHTTAELFCIIIAGCIFVITWNSRKYINNDYLLFITGVR